MGISMAPQIVWLVLLVVFLIAEAVTMGLATIWFAGGSLGAFIASLLGAGILVQIIIFIAVSFLLLLLIRPLAKSRFNSYREKTNAQALIGKTGVVIEPVDNIKAEGRVSVSGQEWAARSADEGGKIAKDALVTVEKISGVKLIVTENINSGEAP